MMPRFDITVSEITDPCSLPWIVTIENEHKVLEVHVKTKEKALQLADKYQTRGWVKTIPAYKFLREAFQERETYNEI